MFGLIASNTIAQGDTRKAGLKFIIEQGGTITRAIRRYKWVGEAAVVVAIIHVFKGVSKQHWLNGEQCNQITCFLFSSGSNDDPYVLLENIDGAFEGMVPYGDGFMLVANALGCQPQFDDFVLPFARGKSLNNSPTPAPDDLIVYFRDLPLSEIPQSAKQLIDAIEQQVRPDRMQRSAEVARAPWWLFWRPRTRLWNKIKDCSSILLRTRVSPHHSIIRYAMPVVPDTSLVVFPDDSHPRFAMLQSRSHEAWARFFASSMKDDLRYTPSDCFETFPFPSDFGSSRALETAGRAYHDHRAALMVARNEGMTKTYNRFHDPTETAEDIQRLHELHAAMDRAVLEAYGRDDLAARAEPVFLDETNEDDHTYQRRLFWPSDFRDEVLARLLALNAERHAEEVRLGIAPGQKAKNGANVHGEDDE